jgi:hypothetical protein
MAWCILCQILNESKHVDKIVIWEYKFTNVVEIHCVTRIGCTKISSKYCIVSLWGKIFFLYYTVRVRLISVKITVIIGHHQDW